MAFNPQSIREDFSLLAKKNPPIYFVNACMTLKPKQVLEAMNQYYEEFPACAGRSVHSLSTRTDQEVHKARADVQHFINAKKQEEIIFLRNTTEGINLLSRTLKLGKGDVVLTTDKEHNSNHLPWHVQAQRKGFSHQHINTNPDNTLDLEHYEELLEQGNIKVVSVHHTSNLDGVTLPAKEIIAKAHKAGALVILDAAQSAPHQELDVRALDADFVAFSGHKLMGPTGTGVLYGKKHLLEEIPHDNVGGETVSNATHTSAQWEGLPHKFEAGLQHYAGIIGLGAATRYLNKIGLSTIHKHEITLNKHITQELASIPSISLIGPTDAQNRGGIFSFNIKGLSGHDVASMLDASKNIMIRSGMHCVHPWFNKRGLPGSARASLYAYNTSEEAEQFVNEVKELVKLRKK